MTVMQRPRRQHSPGAVTVDLDDIQATVLRYRPEPYYGTHVMLHVDDARCRPQFLRDLAPHIDSAADWWQASEPWIAVAITYSGLAALGVPEESLQSFPEAFRAGMAARADQLLDRDANDPQHWESPFGSGVIHIGVSVFSASEEAWRRTMDTARKHYERRPGLTVVATQDFGAQPGDLNPLGYRDSIGQPAIEGSGVEPLPGQGRAIKAGEFILGYPGEAGVPLPAPQPDVLGRNGTYVGLRKYQSRVGAFNRFLQANAQSDEERELLAAKLVGTLAQRRSTDARAGPRQPCPGCGSPSQQRLHLRRRPGRAQGAARRAHAADEPPRQQDGAARRREHPPDYPAQHHFRGAVRPESALASRTTRHPAASIFLFISAKAMATMEFLQQEWINNGNFMSLGDERDPNVGLQQDGRNLHDPAGAGQTPRPRDRDLQRAARWRVLLHALADGTELARKGALTHVLISFATHRRSRPSIPTSTSTWPGSSSSGRRQSVSHQRGRGPDMPCAVRTRRRWAWCGQRSRSLPTSLPRTRRASTPDPVAMTR